MCIMFWIIIILFRVIDGSMKNFKAFFRWLYVGKHKYKLSNVEWVELRCILTPTSTLRAFTIQGTFIRTIEFPVHNLDIIQSKCKSMVHVCSYTSNWQLCSTCSSLIAVIQKLAEEHIPQELSKVNISRLVYYSQHLYWMYVTFTKLCCSTLDDPRCFRLCCPFPER